MLAWTCRRLRQLTRHAIVCRPLTENLVRYAGRHCFSSLLRFGIDMGFKHTMLTCFDSKPEGHVNAMASACQLMEAQYRDQSKRTYLCDTAALWGHCECLMYLHAKGFAFGDSTFSSAASNGHLDCMQFLYEQGCKWNEATCSAAASGRTVRRTAAGVIVTYDRSLVCLKFLRERGCPWDHRTVATAAWHGNMLCLDYATDQGCDLTQDQDNVFNFLQHDVDLEP